MRAIYRISGLITALSMSIGTEGPASASEPSASADQGGPVPDDAAAKRVEPAPREPIGLSLSVSNSLVLRSNSSESTVITTVGLSYAASSTVSPFVRVGSVYNASTGLDHSAGFANPVLGVAFQFDLSKHLVLGGQSGIMIPVGTGGGESSSAAAHRAWLNSIDWGGAMYAVNHFDLFNGLRTTFTAQKVSLQLESVLHQLFRVRGYNADPIGQTVTVTGTTATASYALLPKLSVSTALSETRVWNTPTYVSDDRNSRTDYFFSAGASTTMSFNGFDFSPGLLYARALDMPLSGQGFQVAELDLALSL